MRRWILIAINSGKANSSTGTRVVIVLRSAVNGNMKLYMFSGRIVPMRLYGIPADCSASSILRSQIMNEGIKSTAQRIVNSRSCPEFLLLVVMKKSVEERE